MEFALVDGERTRAALGVYASCPQCAARMIPKCGEIVVHHWAHEVNDCDPWWEPETEWHRSWKRLVPDDRVEVTMSGHRADMIAANGSVVELQHSGISIDDIRAREQAYGKMVWLFDGSDITDDALELRPGPTYWTFRWKHPRKSYAFCTCPVFIDLIEHVFWLKRLFVNNGPPYGGWGHRINPYAFRHWITDGTWRLDAGSDRAG